MDGTLPKTGSTVAASAHPTTRQDLFDNMIRILQKKREKEKDRPKHDATLPAAAPWAPALAGRAFGADAAGPSGR
jgi:hypothetical protein